MHELLRLLWGTILLRPYVFTFLAVYLVAGWQHIGWKRTLAYIPLGIFWHGSLSFHRSTGDFPTEIISIYRTPMEKNCGSSESHSWILFPMCFSPTAAIRWPLF